ncbi:hypothetical protein SY88_07475 [Clostridiales bacterium PH28_bin88]|nr:hypothetical protein SY88_07475 [Clostridiales bacterium PH28_bin88]
MAFDQTTRNRLQKFVSDARDLLTKEFTRQIQAEYGMDPATGGVSCLDSLTHLEDNRRETARLLRDTLEHYLAGSPSRNVKECIDRIVREQAFTVLNRLCALRMAEARGIIIESIANGYKSKGFQLYARLAGAALGETGDAYRCYLFSVFDECALDLAVLFDRFSPQGRLFPRESVLLELLDLINHPDIAPLWIEDETIGWIYQYFNSPEERRQMRAESQAPRNSRELAVRNQFFTPRYVVEFLTDNTLGRIWYEMTRGNTVLKDQCRYLVRRPNEIFLDEGEQAPEQVEPVEDFSQEELLKQPVYIPYRRLKDPREICMLDPACGSMHFGLYAFDLFERIYEEAWDLEGQADGGIFARSEKLKPLRETYESKEALMRDVPRLIIEHNIHGIDIDPRAVQIAGLSLWLRAQRSWQAQGIRPQDRPQILKSNVVCAEPMPGEKEMLREFTEGLEPRVLGQLVEVIFDKMQLAGEAGSLLKIEEEIEETVAKAREEFNKELLRRQDAANSLFPEFLPPRQQTIYDFTDLPDKTEFWNEAEQKILNALQEYAEQAETTQANRKRLFARDTTRGFAFIDICWKQYDVVLMNPPFGDPVNSIRVLIKTGYGLGTDDLGMLIVARVAGLLQKDGFIGALTSRTYFAIPTGKEWRNMYLLKKPHITVTADLGYGVLDTAMVEAAAYVLQSQTQYLKSTFISLLQDQIKEPFLQDATRDIYKGTTNSRIYVHSTDTFLKVPGQVLAYWWPSNLLKKIGTLSSLKHEIGEVKKGLVTGDDFRFLRLAWEMPPSLIGSPNTWEYCSKGGEYASFYDDIHMLMNWKAVKSEMKVLSSSRIYNTNLCFKKGAVYPKRTTSDLSPRPLSTNCCFNDGAQFVALSNTENAFVFIGFAYTRVFKVLVELLYGGGDVSVSGSAARNYTGGVLEELPCPNLQDSAFEYLLEKSRDAICLAMKRCCSDENSRLFTSIPIVPRKTLKETIRNILNESHKRELQIGDLSYEIDKEFTRIFGLGDDGVSFLERAWGPHPYQYAHSEERFLLTWQQISTFLSNTGIADFSNTNVSRRVLTKKGYFSDRVLEIGAHMTQSHPKHISELLLRDSNYIAEQLSIMTKHLVSYIVGLVVGRWDIRYATGEMDHPKLPDPFDPLPISPPGMLQNADCLPAEPNDILENYPLQISWSGILVDDEGHREDIVGRVREAIEVIWKEKAGNIEQEICEILGVSSLREYFAKPGNFFEEHLKRYSKSRRQAPIYWPISTASGSYTLWLYYHRLTDQTIYTCVNDFIEPKLKEVAESASRLRQKSHRSNAEEKELERLSDLELELRDFRDELLRIAALWKPNLNDGVQITAAPLWKLFRHTPWQKTMKETWQKLEKGEYDWAHLAYSIWPERVREKCKYDKSLAIAHNLEGLYEEKPAGTKKKGGSRGKKQLSGEQ